MDYLNVPTTVFTPLEYGSCGLSEEDAMETLGAKNVEVYHASYTPLEWSVVEERPSGACFAKLICDKSAGKRVVGFHILAPNAGEVAQVSVYYSV